MLEELTKREERVTMKLQPVTDEAARIYRLVEMNTEQIRTLDRDKTVVIIPGGPVEEHGPYLPCFTDGYLGERIGSDLARAIASRLGWTALIFPTVPLGAAGANTIGDKDSFPGSCTVRATTLRAVYMDLASELGEQGFHWIFVTHFHLASTHNSALHQACAYFNDTYHGRMVNLAGMIDLSTLQNLSKELLSAEDYDVTGLDVHAGAGETSWMLFVQPGLVDSAYRNAAPQRGESWRDLVRIAKAPNWPGYFSSPAIASASYGAVIHEKATTTLIALALRVLDGEDVDAAVLSDRTPLLDKRWARRKQQEWLEKNGLG
jgi:creatinine amidohydrolase/Fe(II)-dependent formamide hydrolase-like protein